VNRLFKAFISVPPNQETTFKVDLSSGHLIRAFSGDTFFHCHFPIEGKEEALHRAIVDVQEKEISVPLRRGKNEIIFRNLTDRPVGIIIVESNLPKVHALLEQYPASIRPFLSGKALLNNQTFRQLFKIPELSPRLCLNIRSLTILFTDLKGSTQLYDRTGDVYAYDIIQEHFKVLERIVKAHSGAIIKTMGDAIMATFSTAYDGTAAALEMLDQIKAIRAREAQLELKIGLHEGPALAINNEGKLDYFGQTVNISARVQALAKPSEILLTRNVFEDPQVQRIFPSEQLEFFDAELRGIGQKTRVYKYASA
jgi:class 3 adenylate cyclase